MKRVSGSGTCRYRNRGEIEYRTCTIGNVLWGFSGVGTNILWLMELSHGGFGFLG